jgi:hypothetical protein
MLDVDRHQEWHREQDALQKSPEMALLDEDALKTLLGDVMGLALDSFQRGMQRYLDEQFLQVEKQIEALRKPVPASDRWAPGTPWRG